MLPPTTHPSTTLTTLEKLEIRGRDGISSYVPLQRRRMTIGRADDADIHIPHPTVSFHHAELFRDPFERWWIRDLNSRNGVKVDGVRVKDRVMRAQERVRIGDFYLRLMPTAGLQRLRRAAASVETRDRSGSTFSTLFDHSRPRVDARHLEAALSIGQQLLDTPEAATRDALVCDALVAEPFEGIAAFVLRVSRESPAEPVEILSKAQSPRATSPQLYVSRTLVRKVVESGQPVLAGNSQLDGKGVQMSISGSIAELAAVACPLRDTEATMEILYLLLSPDCGNAEWLALASMVARLAQQAEVSWSRHELDLNNRAIEKELQRAAMIQPLIPEKPSVTGIDLAIGFQPCRWVGGDYVDVLNLPDGRVLLVIADVCGKGMSAALVAGQIHAIVHSSIATAKDPSTLIRAMDSYLTKTLPGNSFVTAMLLLFDPVTGDFECVNAGHPPALVIASGRPAAELQYGEHMPLATGEEGWRIQHGRIEPDEWLALFTDGITEMPVTGGKMLGIRGTASLLCEIGARNPASAAVFEIALTEHLDALRGSALPHDDRTFLIARRTS